MNIKLKHIDRPIHKDAVDKLKEFIETFAELSDYTDRELEIEYEIFSQQEAEASWLRFDEKDIDIAKQVLSLKYHNISKYNDFIANLEYRCWLVEFFDFLIDKYS